VQVGIGQDAAQVAYSRDLGRLLRLGDERCGKRTGQRGEQESAAVHPAMVGRIWAKVNQPTELLSPQRTVGQGIESQKAVRAPAARGHGPQGTGGRGRREALRAPVVTVDTGGPHGVARTYQSPAWLPRSGR
jgi:hypothetical protein